MQYGVIGRRGFRSSRLEFRLDFLAKKSVHTQGTRRAGSLHMNTVQNPRTLLHTGAESRDYCRAKRTSNRSHMTSNRVSAIKTRILKIRDQRLARETGATLQKIKKSARQKLAIATLTRGNIACISVDRTCVTETG